MSYTSMNLHYSQTSDDVYNSIVVVLYLYEFTLLSNPLFVRFLGFSGLIPLWIYITLKLDTSLCIVEWVLYLYEFTLLSNL